MPAALVKIGDGTHSIGQFNGTDQVPFLQALATLPDGGTILVGPGVYTFTMPVSVLAPRIAISGSGATLVSSNDVDVGLFDVGADQFALSGVELREDVPTQGHALLRITAGRARIRDCTFIGGDAGTFEPHFIRLVGQECDSLIEENSFFPDKGWTGIHATDSASLNVVRNSFNGIGTGGPLLMKHAVWAYNSAFGLIEGNKFLSLGAPEQEVDSVIYSENSTTDMHHWVIANNTFHLVTCLRVMHLRGSSFTVIEGNSLGRILNPSLVAAIEIAANSGGYSPVSTSITNNEFHNLATLAVKINGGADFLIASNLFTLVNSTVIEIGAQQPTDYTNISSNLFKASAGFGSEHAIRLHDGVGHAVLSNSVYAFPTPWMYVGPAILPADVSVQSNYYCP
ncbi:MAG: right-handed parallel beta-helix repeat-containing protein [Planctomycetota bacterium]